MRTNWFASGPTWCVRSTRRAIAFLSAHVTARSSDIILDDVTSLLSACQ